jgi:hypothetical protein
MAGNVPTYSGNHLLAAGVNHGNTKLWTAMWPGGVIKNDPDYVDKDGSIHVKFGWWRGISARLSIQGRRLDASVPPLGLRSRTAWRPWLPASGVIFPTGGYWEITGKLARRA